MMYIHYCKLCNRLFMLNGHKLICPRCTKPLTELRISYIDYVDLNAQEREKLLETCADEEQLKTIKTTYRMYKYSKWYKELQANNPDNLPVTEVLANMMIQQMEEKAQAAKKKKSRKKGNTSEVKQELEEIDINALIASKLSSFEALADEENPDELIIDQSDSQETKTKKPESNKSKSKESDEDEVKPN